MTGSGSGIGEACALYLDELGFRVFAGVRRRGPAQDLRRKASGRLMPIRLDVTSEASISEARCIVSEALGESGLRGLVNNAGVVVVGPLELLSTGELRDQFEVNVLGAMAVSRMFLPMIRRGGGRIVNMGSMTGRVSFPFAGPYSASKSALAALTDSLRVELEPWDIPVSLIEPGNVQTHIWNKHLSYVDRLLADLPEGERRLYSDGLAADSRMVKGLMNGGLPPRRVAEAVAHALTSRRPKARYPVGADSRAMALASKLLPDRVRDMLIVRYMKLPSRKGAPADR